MADETNYNDPSGLEKIDYDQEQVSPEVKKHTKNVRHKMFGRHVRESIARAIEVIDLTAQSALNFSKKAFSKSEDTENRLDNQIRDLTSDSEIIDFRYSKMLKKTYNILKDRGDFWDEEIANRGVNPIWFGALPDTGIPAQEAFKKAFIKSNVLCVTQGTYKITGTIELPENAKILCFGNVIFDCDTGLRAFNGANKKGIALLNFEMNEKGSVSQSNPQDGSKGIYLDDCSDFLVQDVKTTGFGAWGIVAVNSKDFIITRSEGYKSVRQSGIAVSNCEDYTISNCKCDHNYYSGIIAEPAGKNGRIVDNTCRYNSQGILIKDDGDNTLVSRNTINFNKEYGLYTEYTKNILYSDNVSKYNGDSTRKNVGFGFYGKNTEDISLLNNDIQLNNAHGIYFENVDGFVTKKPTIKGNTIKRNCITYEHDNQGEIYIAKATDLISSSNSIDPTGRAYVIGAESTFIEFDQKIISRLSSAKKSYAELVPFSRNLQKVSVSFSSSLRQVVFSKPFNMRVVHVEARCMLRFASSIELKINGVARLVTKVTDPNREYSSANQVPINYSLGEDINLQIANTVNNDYILYYILDIFYI